MTDERRRPRLLGRPVAFLHERDPGLLIVHRAFRVTIAASSGFFVCLYLVGDVNAGVYALFATVALGALSEVDGTPAQRTRTYLCALVVGLALASLGTVLAVNTWAAAAGMLVVGFLVSFAAVGGPRVAAVASGLQLFYVLPCFPPYTPELLGERLIGLTVGVLLLVLADRLLWPAPSPPDLVPRVAYAAGAAAALAEGLRTWLVAGAPDGDGRIAALRAEATHAGAQLRASTLPPAARPTGPSRHDRSLTHASLAVRVVIGRLGLAADRLAEQRAAASTEQTTAPAPAGARSLPGEPGTSPETAGLLDTDAKALAAVRDALLGEGATPPRDVIDQALSGYVERETFRLAGAVDPAPWLRGELAVSAVTESVRTLVLAIRATLGAPAPPPADTPVDFWFLHASPVTLWWRRLRAHMTPRSVYLQNAIRLAIGLAVARIIAGVLALTHGFWVLLATLSLMRTSAVASRAVLLQAFTGTIIGAIIAAVLLTLVGPDTHVYAWLTPLLMLAAFAAGPLLGLGAAQAGFTLVVSVVFAQVAPANWELAEDRVFAVIIGGLVGALIGAAVWPRGGTGEVRRVAADCMRAGADEIVASAAYLTGTGPPPSTEPLTRLSTLFEYTYAQYRSEPARPGPEPEWLVVLAVANRIAEYSRTLCVRYPATDPLPWPDFGVLLRADAQEVADAYREAATAVAAGRAPSGDATALRAQVAAQHLAVRFAEAPAAALRAFDGWGWIHRLVDELERVEQALTPAPPSGPEPARTASLS
ncbi:FUSC family protein [Pseudonocardia sp. CA-142604]|uniref:FUSC family protein n=1 Tax=Pseudonocardia sp. CA-142604 TaxID=3240024 RepID=UPI003D8A9D35